MLAHERQERAVPAVTADRDRLNSIPATLQATAARVADSSCTALVTGETGVGKGQLARWLHEHSRRRDRPFIPVNCGAIPGELIDSQLFGHVRGAFTGAERDHSGLVRAADGGTLLLDEISELPMTAQVRLLRLLEEREVMPVGRPRPEQVDVRIIAATHSDLWSLVRDDRFREDLYYRLNVIQLHVPPLRQRTEEIIGLFDAFNREFSELYEQAPVELRDDALRVLERYDWPGNVRELRIVVERLHVLCPDDVVTPTMLGRYGQLPVQSGGGHGGSIIIEPKLAHDLPQRMQEARLSAVRKVLAECGGNVSSAARSIGVHRSTLYRWLQDAPQCA